MLIIFIMKSRKTNCLLFDENIKNNYEKNSEYIFVVVELVFWVLK